MQYLICAKTTCPSNSEMGQNPHSSSAPARQLSPAADIDPTGVGHWAKLALCLLRLRAVAPQGLCRISGLRLVRHCAAIRHPDYWTIGWTVCEEGPILTKPTSARSCCLVSSGCSRLGRSMAGCDRPGARLWLEHRLPLGLVLGAQRTPMGDTPRPPLPPYRR
jgi:hypothetical protein